MRLKINIEKAKMIVCGSSDDEPVKTGRNHWAVCGSGVGVNSALCTHCYKW